MSGNRVFLVAAEPSGDALGADLIAALRTRDPALQFSAIGGAAMAKAGAASQMPIDDLAILGFIEGLKAWKRVIARADQAADLIVAAKPDAVVLIDSWGFTLRVAQRLKARIPNTPLIKYIGPQVWATRPGRAKTLAAVVDHLICIHRFETPYYAPFGLPCTVCGVPAMSRMKRGDGAAFRVRHGLAPDAPLLLVLPGSRTGEVRRIGPTFWRAAEALRVTRPDLRFAIVLAGHVAEMARAQAPANALLVSEEEKEDAFAAATVALAASGTVTTEVAAQGTPVVVGYKMGWITWALVRLVMLRVRYVTLMNVAADREVAPEIIQTRFFVSNFVRAVGKLLDDPAARSAQIAAQNAALDSMGRGDAPAAEIAADAVLSVLAKAP